jgi:RsiW-degrading membrane proteinase PrsW (M82 family)
MNYLTYIAAGLPPATALVLYGYLVLRNNKRFGLLLIKSYFAGMLGTVVLLLSFYISSSAGMAKFSSLYDTLLYSFLIVGFASELGKFLVLRFFVISKPEVDTPIHGITFSVMTALGFSTISVLFFLFDIYESKPPYPTNMYLLLSAPSNIIFAIIMGFFLGIGKFMESRFIYSLAGLLAASFFNGLFKFCLISHDYKLLNIFAFGSAIIIVILIIKAINFRPG